MFQEDEGVGIQYLPPIEILEDALQCAPHPHLPSSGISFLSFPINLLYFQLQLSSHRLRPLRGRQNFPSFVSESLPWVLLKLRDVAKGAFENKEGAFIPIPVGCSPSPTSIPFLLHESRTLYSLSTPVALWFHKEKQKRKESFPKRSTLKPSSPGPA